MTKFLRWASVVVGLFILGLALYIAKLKHDLDISLRAEINRHFADAGAQIQVLGGGNTPEQTLTERERSLFGQTAMSEYLMSFRIAGYYTEQGAIPSSVEEADSSSPGRQASPRDPWGNPFRLVSEGKNGFLILSGGPSGSSLLTPQEKKTLSKQLGGRTYLLNGKVVFKGDLSLVPLQKHTKSPAGSF